MAITRIDTNQVYDRNGNLLSEETVEVDITEEVNKATIEQAIEASLVRLQELVDAPALPTPPNGTMTNAVLSDVVRSLRNHAQDTRAGAQEVALTLKRTIRLVRGDFDGTD